MATSFSHDVRVLACEHCGAPLEAAVAGGLVKCGYCGASSEVRGRDESEDQAVANAPAAMGESERLEQLRRQIGEPLALPPSLSGYLTPGKNTLDPRRLADAQKDWTATRNKLEAGGAIAAERLFHLTRLIAPALDERHERALLETAVEVLPDPRHRQLLRRRLVVRSVLAGDVAAAQAWLAPCHPRPTDLQMDTAYRVAAAFVATATDNPGQVLTLLGPAAGDVPIAGGNELVAGVLRAHALERSDRGAEAVAALRQRCHPRGHFAVVAQVLEDNAALRLCSASWPVAREQLYDIMGAVQRNLNISVHGALLVMWSLFTGVLVFAALIVLSVWGTAASALVGVVALVALALYCAVMAVRARRA